MKDIFTTLPKEDFENMIASAVQRCFANREEGIRLLTNKQAQDYLHVCRDTLSKFEKEGKIKPKTFGKRKLYDVNELNKFITNEC